MLKTKLFKVNKKAPGFALSLESLLAATAFSLTAALTWSLVWNGLDRLSSSKKEMETINFIKNKIYESDFQETFLTKKNDIFTKDYSETIFKKIFRVTKSSIAEKSELKPLGKILQKVVFDSKSPAFLKNNENEDGESDNFKLVAFLPFLKED